MIQRKVSDSLRNVYTGVQVALDEAIEQGNSSAPRAIEHTLDGRLGWIVSEFVIHSRIELALHQRMQPAVLSLSDVQHNLADGPRSLEWNKRQFFIAELVNGRQKIGADLVPMDKHITEFHRASVLLEHNAQIIRR